MSKYIETVKVQFKSQLAYRFDIIMNVVLTVSKILLAYVLWSAVFKTQDIVAGFTLNSMMSYYILSSFISQLDQATGTGWHIAEDIRNGSFSSNNQAHEHLRVLHSAYRRSLIIPAHFQPARGSFVGPYLQGGVCYDKRCPSDPSGHCPDPARAPLHGTAKLFHRILAFKVLDVTIFMLIKDNIAEFVKGSLIPLTLLPPGVIGVMKLFPFYYATYLPTMLLLGRNGNEALPGIIILVCWIVLFRFINSLTYKRLRHRYDGVGI
jgi:ABC-2 type transport system permease protein